MPDAETKRLDGRILDFMRRPRGGKDFEVLALTLFEYQFRKNLNYRSFCEAERIAPDNVTRWQDIPAMPAAGFKELVLATFPIRDVVKTFKTSGTTQGYSRGAHLFDSLELYKAAALPTFEKFLLPDGASCRFFFLTASGPEASDSSLSYMMELVNRAFSHPRGRFYIRGGQARFKHLYEDLKATRKPAALLATAFSLKAFLDWMSERRLRLRLPKGSRIMETGGFKGRVREISKKKLYGECAARLGVLRTHCVSEYGMTELSSQFYSASLKNAASGLRAGSAMQGPHWVRTLFIDPFSGREAPKGKPGLVRIFDLANRGSVIAVQTEDVGRAKKNGFELLGRATDSERRGCSLAYERFLEKAG